MAGPSHSRQNYEMIPWVKRDFPEILLLDDPCLSRGEVTPLCKGREKEVGLEGFDAVEAAYEAGAKTLKPMDDRFTHGFITVTPNLVTP